MTVNSGDQFDEHWAMLHPEPNRGAFHDHDGCQYFPWNLAYRGAPCFTPIAASVRMICKTCGELTFRVCMDHLAVIVPAYEDGIMPLYCSVFEAQHAIAAIMGFEPVGW